MIQVFCNEIGAGKTKELISLANSRLKAAKGDSVYIDYDLKHFRQLDRRIRLVEIKDYEIRNYEGFYGLLCGIISENYDVENIYIDTFFDMIKLNYEDLAVLFSKIKSLVDKFNINLFINISKLDKTLPECIKEYVA